MKKTKPDKNAGQIHCIVKRHGKCIAYDERKIYGSVYAACYIVNRNHRKCEKLTNSISAKATRMIKIKKKVSSSILFQFVVKELKKLDKHVAFMYETHRDIS